MQITEKEDLRLKKEFLFLLLIKKKLINFNQSNIIQPFITAK